MKAGISMGTEINSRSSSGTGYNVRSRGKINTPVGFRIKGWNW